MLDSNLRLLARRSPGAAEAIRAAGPRPDIDLRIAPDGGLTGWCGVGGERRQIASLRAPIQEGQTLASTIDVARSAAVIVRGLGAGHHAAALARRLAGYGAVIAFEPDAALLRAVLERADFAPLLNGTNFVLAVSPDDTGALAQSATGLEAVFATGTAMLDHPPSRRRIGESAERFSATLATVIKAVRTNVVTTLVQVDVTVRNLLQNLRPYALGDGISELAQIFKGRPGVVVSAGPSLRRNIDLLARPGVRDRVVIIAVQTVLKQLLARGIRPHFVTALDYHEISRRFYEGLTPSDVEGVTLVVEPKVNPAVPPAFPGAVRCCADSALDEMLGPALARDMGTLPPGATVAHLAYYLARHLGCDPVILVGQDLGFTDGQYYAPGAAIHRVWGGELNEFNTLEMLEWQRIARMRSLLRRARDVHDRPIYTDEQMSTYLVQFERDFLRDAQAGLTTIDATEGGVRKQHTRIATLAEAIVPAAGLPPLPPIPRAGVSADPARLAAVQRRIDELLRSSGSLGRMSRDAGAILSEMLDRHEDQARVNRLIGRVQDLAAKAASESAYWLVQYVNQTGQLNRYKADRAKDLSRDLSPMQRQRAEIERDLQNVRWLGDVADHVRGILEEAARTLASGVVSTREIAKPLGAAEVAGPARHVWAVMPLDSARGGLGIPRGLETPLFAGRGALDLTLARLARCRKIEGLIVLAPDEAQARRLLADAPRGLRIEIAPAPVRAERAASVARARLWSRSCWRGGIANLSCYDEVLDPAPAAAALRARGADAALLLGPDWSFVDPALADAVVERYLERPDSHSLTFTQAAPGLAPCLLTLGALEELAASQSPFATIGGLLGYIPVAPQSDPIAKGVCVQVPPAVRDLCVRCIADTAPHARWLGAALANLAEDAPAAAVADAIISAISRGEPPPADHVRLVLSPSSDLDAAIRDLRRVARDRDDLSLTIQGEDGCDVSAHADLPRLIASARAAGYAGVHVRAALAAEPADVDLLLDAAPDVLSVDLLAESAHAYRRVTGRDCFDRVLANLGAAIERARGRALPRIWVVPRLTRRDDVYEEIEPFYNRWLLACGACVIDPLPAPLAGERIEPLPLPDFVQARREGATIEIRSRAGAPAEARP